jgi:cytochrome P450
VKDVNEYSLEDPAVATCPYDYYKAMRAANGIHYDEKLKTYIVSRHEDILKVLAEPVLYSVEHGFEAQEKQDYTPEINDYYRNAGLPPLKKVVTSDPPYHTRIRALMEKAFTAHRVAAMEGDIDEIANQLIDGFIDQGRMEFIEQFAIPLPIYVIADQLGIPRSDLPAFKRWSDATVEPAGRQLTKERAFWCAEQTVEMWNYLEDVVAERRLHATDDMISDLVHGRIDDPNHPDLSPMELFQVIRAFIVAGNETTTTAISNGLLMLIRNDETRVRLRDSDDDRAWNRLTEEILRLEAPVPGLPRFTTGDTELGGTPLPKGTLLYLAYASANRDDAKFEAPERLQLDRRNAGQHLSFGGGIHRCIGAMLARMEIKVSMRQVLRRLDNLTLELREAELAYRPSMVTRTLVSLPVTFTRR